MKSRAAKFIIGLQRGDRIFANSRQRIDALEGQPIVHGHSRAVVVPASHCQTASRQLCGIEVEKIESAEREHLLMIACEPLTCSPQPANQSSVACVKMYRNMRPRSPAQRRPAIPGGFVGWFNVYGSFRQIIQDLIAPALESIQGKLEAVDAKIDALDTKIESVRASLDAKIEAKVAGLDAKFVGLDARIDSTRETLEAKFDSLRTEVHGLRGEFQDLRLDVRQKWEQSLEIHERLAVIEAKLEIR